MDDSGEFDLKFALEVHGLHGRAFSDSESDHSSNFDEYEEYKPLPVEINSDNVIVIYPSDEENESTDTNIKEPGLKDSTDQPVQNVANTAEIRKESLNPSTIKNDLNGGLPGIKPNLPNPNNSQNFQQPNQNNYNRHNKNVPVFPNFNNMQQFQQPNKEYYNPHAIRVIPVISNPNNLQHFPHNAQHYSNPNAERIRPEFSTSSNMKQLQTVQNDSKPDSQRKRSEFPKLSNTQPPQTVQNYSYPNSERIRPYCPNSSSMQHFQNSKLSTPLQCDVPQFYQTNQYIQNFNTGNSSVPIFNKFSPNVNGMRYNLYQFNRPGIPCGRPYLNHPPNKKWQHTNKFQGYTLNKNTPSKESNFSPRSIHLSPKTLDIMNMFKKEHSPAGCKPNEEKICNAGDITDNNSKIVVSIEELVRAIVVGNLLKNSMNISVIKRFKIDCKPSEIKSKVREQFNMTISELDINKESIVYSELSLKIDELCEYHKECLPSICDANNDINISGEQSRDDCLSNWFSFDATSSNSNTDEVVPTEITVSESSINLQQIEGSYSQKLVSTTIESVDGSNKSTGTIPKKKKAKKKRKLSKKGKTKKLPIVENLAIEPYEEFPAQKLLISVEEAICKKNYEEICEEYVYEDINRCNYLDRSSITGEIFSIQSAGTQNVITEIQCSTESDPSLKDTKRNNIHSSTDSIKLENKRKQPRWKKYPIMGWLISGLIRAMSWIVNNFIKICRFCFL